MGQDQDLDFLLFSNVALYSTSNGSSHETYRRRNLFNIWQQIARTCRAKTEPVNAQRNSTMVQRLTRTNTQQLNWHCLK